MTKDELRADIARILRIPAEEIADDDNLFDLGLDSMRVMDLLLKWETAGLQTDFSRFYEAATLDGWWQIVGEAQAA